MVTEQLGDGYLDSPEVSEPKYVVFSQPINVGKTPDTEETHYPNLVSIDLLLKAGQLNLVSIDLLLKAGQLVEPKVKNQVSLRLEKFHIDDQECLDDEEVFRKLS